MKGDVQGSCTGASFGVLFGVQGLRNAPSLSHASLKGIIFGSFLYSVLRMGGRAGP